HDEVSSWLLRRPAAEQRRWLGAILARLAQDIPAGRLHGLAAAAHVAAHVAESLPHMQDLAGQLFALDARLATAQDPADPPPWVLGLLWREHEAVLPTVARVDLARRLIAAGDAPFADLDPNTKSLTATCIAAISDDLLEIEELASVWLRKASPAKLWRDLAAEGATPMRQELVVGLAAAADGRIEEALRAAMVLATTLGDAYDAARIAKALASGFARRGRPRAQTIRSIHALLDVIAAAQPSDDALEWVLVLAMRTGQVPKALQAEIERRLETVGNTTVQRARALATAIAIGRQDLADRIVTGMGRSLRRKAPDEANIQCLSLICGALGTPMPNDLDALFAVLRPLRAWLLRDGSAPALDAARGLPDTETAQAGMIIWYLRHHQVLGRDPWWIEQLAQFYRGYIGTMPLTTFSHHLLTHLITDTLDAGPMMPSELLDQLDQRMDALDISSSADLIDSDIPY
ncbi:MAG: hypothetical protein GXP62_08405, partial [Oligoflexia bacterium]|nr:hypothetical protein [Oligoflexia bacterium]